MYQVVDEEGKYWGSEERQVPTQDQAIDTTKEKMVLEYLVDFGIESKETTDKVWAEMCKFKYIYI